MEVSITSESDTQEVRKKRTRLRRTRKSTDTEIFSQALNSDSVSSNKRKSAEHLDRSVAELSSKRTRQNSRNQNYSPESNTSTDTEKIQKKRPAFFKKPRAQKDVINVDQFLQDDSVIGSSQNTPRPSKIKPRTTFFQKPNKSSTDNNFLCEDPTNQPLNSSKNSTTNYRETSTKDDNGESDELITQPRLHFNKRKRSVSNNPFDNILDETAPDTPNKTEDNDNENRDSNVNLHLSSGSSVSTNGKKKTLNASITRLRNHSSSRSSTSSISEELKILPTFSQSSKTSHSSLIHPPNRKTMANTSIAEDIHRDWATDNSLLSKDEDDSRRIISEKSTSELIKKLNTTSTSKNYLPSQSQSDSIVSTPGHRKSVTGKIKSMSDRAKSHEDTIEEGQNKSEEKPLWKKQKIITSRRSSKGTKIIMNVSKDNLSPSKLNETSSARQHSQQLLNEKTIAERLVLSKRTTVINNTDAGETVEITDKNSTDTNELMETKTNKSRSVQRTNLTRNNRLSYSLINGEPTGKSPEISEDEDNSAFHTPDINKNDNTTQSSESEVKSNSINDANSMEIFKAQTSPRSSREKTHQRTSSSPRSNKIINEINKSEPKIVEQRGKSLIPKKLLQGRKISRQLTPENDSESDKIIDSTAYELPNDERSDSINLSADELDKSQNSPVKLMTSTNVVESLQKISSHFIESIPSTSGTQKQSSPQTKQKSSNKSGIIRSYKQTSFLSFLKPQVSREPRPSVELPIIDPNSELNVKLRALKPQRDAMHAKVLAELDKQAKEAKLTTSHKVSLIPKNTKKTPKPIDKAFMVNGKPYKQPKLPRPQHWATDRLYKYLWKLMEPKFGEKTRILSEKFVTDLAASVAIIKRRKKYANYVDELNDLMRKMAKLGIVKTPNDFYHFCYDFLPYEFRVKVTPILHPGNVHIVPFDPVKDEQPILDQ